MEDFILGGNLGHRHDGFDSTEAVAFHALGRLWVVAGERYKPTPWMLFRRRSPDGDMLSLLTRHINRRAKVEIISRYSSIPHFDVERASDAQLYRHIRHMIESARLQLFALQPDEQPRLFDLNDPLFHRPANYDLGLPGDGSVPEDIRQHRFQLGEELGRILLTRWTRKDIEDRLYWDEPYWSRALIGTGALMLGTWDGLTALWESLKSLLKLGVIVAEVAWDVVVFHVKLGANIAQGDIDAAVADLKRVGLKGIETLQDIKELVMQGKAMLDLLMEDQHSRRMLANYLIGWTDSVGDVALMRGAVATTVEIGLEVLIAIASLGAGAAVAAGSIARRIGPFTARALEMIADLVRMMRNVARRNKASAKPEAGGHASRHSTSTASDRPQQSASQERKPHTTREDVGETIRSKRVSPTGLDEAESILQQRRAQIATHGYQPKYSDAELTQLAQHGDVGKERFQVRFMEARFLQDRNTPSDPLSGKMGAVMEGETGKGAKYWSTSFDQIEDADTDPKLISEKLGLEYDPKREYIMVIVDTEKAAPLTGAKSVPATFDKVSEFANTELPADFPKSFTDKAMTPEFQAEYNKHYNAAVESGALPNQWSKDADLFEEYLQATDLSQDEKDLLIKRMEMHEKIGNNQDYLGNGLTKELNPDSANDFGAVETLNFERQEVNFKALDDAGAVKIMRGLTRT